VIRSNLGAKIRRYFVCSSVLLPLAMPRSVEDDILSVCLAGVEW